jgi:hypothetical protein
LLSGRVKSRPFASLRVWPQGLGFVAGLILFRTKARRQEEVLLARSAFHHRNRFASDKVPMINWLRRKTFFVPSCFRANPKIWHSPYNLLKKVKGA